MGRLADQIATRESHREGNGCRKPACGKLRYSHQKLMFVDKLSPRHSASQNQVLAVNSSVGLLGKQSRSSSSQAEAKIILSSKREYQLPVRDLSAGSGPTGLMLAGVDVAIVERHGCHMNRWFNSRLRLISLQPAAAAQRSFAEPSVTVRNRLMYLAPSLL